MKIILFIVGRLSIKNREACVNIHAGSMMYYLMINHKKHVHMTKTTWSSGTIYSYYSPRELNVIIEINFLMFIHQRWSKRLECSSYSAITSKSMIMSLIGTIAMAGYLLDFGCCDSLDVCCVLDMSPSTETLSTTHIHCPLSFREGRKYMRENRNTSQT